MSNRKKQLCISALGIASRLLIMTVIGFGAVSLSHYVGSTVPAVSVATSDPTAISNSTEIADPTITSEPTTTSDPTATSEPTTTSDSTEIADPTATSDPTAIADSTATSDPTETAEPEPHNVAYVLGDELFLSRGELYRAFFGDFYDFIRTHGGDTGLVNEGFTDRESFLCAIEYSEPGSQYLREHANSFGGYFMSMRANSTLADQPSTSFLGYCRDNGRWTGLIRELSMYFSCWRSDEGCAGLHNSGADFYADTWSTFVDIYIRISAIPVQQARRIRKGCTTISIIRRAWCRAICRTVLCRETRCRASCICVGKSLRDGIFRRTETML